MTTNESNNIENVVRVALIAGKIMLQNGAETYRVEDTMTRIANAFQVTSHSFVTPTGIIFSIEGDDPTKLIRVSERSIDLRKVTSANQISRELCNGKISLDDAYQKLLTLDETVHAYPFVFQLIAAAITSACFLIMFNGTYRDFIPAFATGGLGFFVFYYFHRIVRIKFFAEFLAALAIGLVALLFVHTGIGRDRDTIIIGSVMPLVPGLLITNAVRDLLAGHFVSGTSKGIEAFLTAFAIGAGIAVSLSIFAR